MPPQPEERLAVYDEAGGVVGSRPRREAKASGLALGAVNVLLVDGRGEVLLQRRPRDKENGGLWDKSVGGHVGAGEDFDATALREAGEELFDEAASTRVVLAGDEEEFALLLAREDLTRRIVMRRVAVQLNLRDVRHAPGGAGLRNVRYHVAVYLARTELPLAAFSPQASEIEELRYFEAAAVDRLLVEGRLAPNMGFLWLAQGHALLKLAGRA
jgi:8-oxo-dGTP pyrophosphatase MutT (NUDIX family)